MARLSPQDPQPSLVQYRGNLVPPTTSYARSVTDTAFGSRENIESQASTVRTRSAVVTRAPRMNGMRFAYGYGKEEAQLPHVYPGGNDGGVRSSAFQTFKNHLYNFVLNDGLFAAGYPRNLGLSFRVPAIRTNPTGGSTPSRMDQKPQFTKVQSVPRYSTVPAAYETRGAKS